MIERLTGDFEHLGRVGYLAAVRGAFLFVGRTLPPVPLPPDAALLGRLRNADILRHGARVPCREKLRPGDPAGDEPDPPLNVRLP